MAATMFRTWFTVTLILLGGSAIRADDKVRPPGGAAPASDSPPVGGVPRADARQDLGQVARAQEGGVYLLGYPGGGTGTGWVISKKHRLLVTNAHVADIFHATGGKMLAIPSGGTEAVRVTRVWYHPGVRRFLFNCKDPPYSARSTDPGEGKVDPVSPDLAIVQLAADGDEPAVEFKPATADEVGRLFAQPAAMIGYPAHDTEDWPKPGERAQATFHDGVISRITDFDKSVSGPAPERQFVQFTIPAWNGFSGSPVFLPSGHVAAVLNSADTVKNRSGSLKTTIPHGVRIDCVAELLVHHGLEDRVPFRIDRSKVLVDRWLKPDARSVQARAVCARAVALVGEARDLCEKGQYRPALDRCDRAAKLVPTLAAANYWRSVTAHRIFSETEGLTRSLQQDLLTVAHADAFAALESEPSNLAYRIHVCRVSFDLGRFNADATVQAAAVEALTGLLERDKLPTGFLKAEARAVRGHVFKVLGRLDDALRDLSEAVRLDPLDARYLASRATIWSMKGRGAQAAADRALADRARKGDIEVKEVASDGSTVFWVRRELIGRDGDKYVVDVPGSRTAEGDSPGAGKGYGKLPTDEAVGRDRVRVRPVESPEPNRPYGLYGPPAGTAPAGGSDALRPLLLPPPEAGKPYRTRE